MFELNPETTALYRKAAKGLITQRLGGGGLDTPSYGLYDTCTKSATRTMAFCSAHVQSVQSIRPSAPPLPSESAPGSSGTRDARVSAFGAAHDARASPFGAVGPFGAARDDRTSPFGAARDAGVTPFSADMQPLSPMHRDNWASPFGIATPQLNNNPTHSNVVQQPPIPQQDDEKRKRLSSASSFAGLGFSRFRRATSALGSTFMAPMFGGGSRPSSSSNSRGTAAAESGSTAAEDVIHPLPNATNDSS